MKYIVDTISDGYAVLETENKNNLTVKESDLPVGTREGSILISDNGKFVLDKYSEDARRKKLFAMKQKIMNRNNSQNNQ